MGNVVRDVWQVEKNKRWVAASILYQLGSVGSKLACQVERAGDAVAVVQQPGSAPAQECGE